MFKKTLSLQEMDKTDVSLATLVEEYLFTCRLEGKIPKTVRGYREKLNRYVNTVGGVLADFNLHTAGAYKDSLQKAKKFGEYYIHRRIFN